MDHSYQTTPLYKKASKLVKSLNATEFKTLLLTIEDELTLHEKDKLLFLLFTSKTKEEARVIFKIK